MTSQLQPPQPLGHSASFLFLAPLPSPTSQSPPPRLVLCVCVDAIALGWKGLASNDAKNNNKFKKKTQEFPSYSTCTYSEMNCIILTRVYYCWGLPSSSEGYFVLPAALSLRTKITAHGSLRSIIWWCVDTSVERQEGTVGN